ncbi:Serine incorporator (Serinc) [Musa troglodytarum]|uniref:Serine incorporator (Serinc) n=1 Tax=Musa troglodytarum TaxID=320322 RepID=A0A9E7LDN6_9LILI|nr:Serine incorporator (Serinc) [Musa troglodytarum]
MFQVLLVVAEKSEVQLMDCGSAGPLDPRPVAGDVTGKSPVTSCSLQAMADLRLYILELAGSTRSTSEIRFLQRGRLRKRLDSQRRLEGIRHHLPSPSFSIAIS